MSFAALVNLHRWALVAWAEGHRGLLANDPRASQFVDRCWRWRVLAMRRVVRDDVGALELEALHKLVFTAAELGSEPRMMRRLRL